jgi:hypothetical protein
MVDYDDWEVGDNPELLEDGTRVGESYQEEFAAEIQDNNSNQSSTSSNSSVSIPERPSVIIESYYEIPESRGNVFSNYDIDETIELTFPQPNISVDTSIRTVEHEIIGSETVVQKLGKDSDEIEVEGICTQNEAKSIDSLSSSDYIYLRSYRREDYMVLDSTSTSPISDGGAIMGTTNNGKKFEWSHEFTLSGNTIKNPEE